jgi:two-component system, cell cycle sensor histidine kinase and response regulator CckA
VMPGMGGRELGTRLQNTHPGVPVLFMSAHTGDELARRRLLSPGIWFLQKPFAPDELVSQVQLRLHAAARS